MSFAFIVRIFLRTILISAVLTLLAVGPVDATHLRAGEISVQLQNCNSRTYKITIKVFTKSKGTPVLFGGDENAFLDFGDGARVLVPETGYDPPFAPGSFGKIRLDLDPEGSIAEASFSISHTFPGPGQYTIWYSEPNRNEGVLNMDNSVNTQFYLETIINIDPFLGCNNLPLLLVPPIDRACKGVAWFHNPGAYDPDNRDSLSYKLVVPFSSKDQTVLNYKDPNHEKFYTNFGQGNEDGNGPPTFFIDSEGTITWDAPGAVGEYNIAFIIEEWRIIKGVWYPMGSVRRDMQIIVEECENERPDLIVPKDTCVEAGTILKATIFGIDPENDPVKIEAFSEIFSLASAQSPATFTPTPPDFIPSNPPAELHFNWNTKCLHIRDQPYQVVFKITDNSPTGSKLVTFKTWFIKVIGPAPKWDTVKLNLAKRHATLEWEPYQCYDGQEADKMEVWRRTDSFNYTPDYCETGMPSFLGYTKIAEVDMRDNNGNPVTKFIDTNGGKGLAQGAQYCYRLVVLFALPKSGESYVSEEYCIDPILADAPVITHVTIDKSAQTDGKITVRWIKPFNASPIQFPPPYTYEVYRANGFAGEGGIQKASLSLISDTTFTDTDINTEQNVYNYRIVCYDANSVIVDTSAVASSVRLEAKSQIKKIELDWSAFVPWSIQSQLYPRHLIYRGPEGATVNGDLQLIDSIDVNLNGFKYVDEGQFNGVPLDDNTVYSYQVMTKGSYGNPTIIEPFKNFSQIISAQPGDSIPPCKPNLPVSINPVSCDDYIQDTSTCGQNTFSNTITWNRPEDSACRSDVRSYNVYITSHTGGDFIWLANTGSDTFYLDDNLSSYARCYKISAVDRSGNESELSDAFCIDNCPYYELPNIFTPNNDGCNDKFSAYSNRENSGETGTEGCTISEENKKKCARFVENVICKIYNRWGKEVYSYESGGENSIYIDWNGHDSNGRELSSGVYYFIADVTFDVVDPSKNVKKIKGWVHLLR